ISSRRTTERVTKSLSVKRKSSTSPWRHSMSSTKKTPEHSSPADDLPWEAEAAAAVAVALVPPRGQEIMERGHRKAIHICCNVRSNPRTRLSGRTLQEPHRVLRLAAHALHRGRHGDIGLPVCD